MTDKVEVTLECSGCERPIALLLVTPNDKKWRVRATCPYGCTVGVGIPDTSYIKEFNGVFRVSGYFRENPNNPLDVIQETLWVGTRNDASQDGPVETFIMARAQ